MQILIHSNGFDMTDSLSAHIKSRVKSTLARFNGLIRTIVVSVVDENGPKGGVDKTCTVRIKTDELSELVVRNTESDAYAAVGRAVARSKHALTKQLQRTKTFDRKRTRLDRQTIGQQNQPDLQEGIQSLRSSELDLVSLDAYQPYQYDEVLSRHRY